jgi:hypothetical protein
MSAPSLLTTTEQKKTVPWVNPDVHARTNEMRIKLAEEFSDLPRLTQLYAQNFDTALREIKLFYRNDGEIAACLDKMDRRKDIVDHDMYIVDSNKDHICISPSGLLALLWDEKIKPNESYVHFRETLLDMGLTCPQGDSHRLFASYVAFSRPSLPV